MKKTKKLEAALAAQTAPKNDADQAIADRGGVATLNNKPVRAKRAADAYDLDADVINGPRRHLSVSLACLRESPFNRRKDFGDLEELQRSISAHGILQPLVVRVHSELNGVELFELVFGHRRLRAAKNLGLAGVPCIVHPMDDGQVIEAQLVENSQRHDINPLEEAEALDELVKKYGRSIDELADKIGKSRASVYARLKLVDLPPKAKELVRSGRLPASHALLVARIPVAKLAERAALELANGVHKEWEEDPDHELETQDPRPMGYRKAIEHVRTQYMLALAGASFATDDASLVPAAGPCTICPKRSGNQKELFGDVKSPDICTDPSCFKTKLDADWKRKSVEHVKAGGEVLPLARAEKLFRHGGLNYGTGFVELNQPLENTAGKKTWEAALSKSKAPPPIVLARDEDGVVHRLFEEKAARAAAVKVGAIRKQPKSQTAAGDQGWKKAEAKRRKEREQKERLMGLVLDQVVAAARSPLGEEANDALGLLLVEGLVSQMAMGEGGDLLVERRGIKPNKKSGYHGAGITEALCALVRATTAPEELRALSVEAVMLEELLSGEYRMRRGGKSVVKPLRERIFAALGMNEKMAFAIAAKVHGEQEAARTKAAEAENGSALKKSAKKAASKKAVRRAS